MKRTILIFSAALLVLFMAKGQSTKPSFSFYYSFAGLGSNMGSMQPTIRIDGTRLLYTYEQNSYYKEQTKSPDTICIVTISQSSIDSILTLVNDLKDTTISGVNICVMSGGVHSMMIAANHDTTCFSLSNTFHRRALKISAIINQYLPSGKHIWATEQDIIDSENCWAARIKEWEVMKKEE